MSNHPSIEQDNLVIRQATRKDLEVIGDLWVELMSFHANLDPRFAIPAHGRNSYIRHIYAVLRDDNYRVYVAEADGQIIGYILGYIAQNPPIFPHPQYGFIADISISPSSRRQGAGTQLVATLRSWFRSRGLTNIQLNVAANNPVSQAFWRKMGCTDYLHHVWMPVSE